MKRYLSFLIVLTMILSVAACARIPKAKTAERKIYKFFKKYGKEYPDTIYGKLPVKSVDVEDMEEIHFHLISVDAFLMLGDTEVKKINATLEKKVLWKVVSWENVL